MIDCSSFLGVTLDQFHQLLPILHRSGTIAWSDPCRRKRRWQHHGRPGGTLQRGLHHPAKPGDTRSGKLQPDTRPLRVEVAQLAKAPQRATPTAAAEREAAAASAATTAATTATARVKTGWRAEGPVQHDPDADGVPV